MEANKELDSAIAYLEAQSPRNMFTLATYQVTYATSLLQSNNLDLAMEKINIAIAWGESQIMDTELPKLKAKFMANWYMQRAGIFRWEACDSNYDKQESINGGMNDIEKALSLMDNEDYRERCMAKMVRASLHVLSGKKNHALDDLVSAERELSGKKVAAKDFLLNIIESRKQKLSETP